MEFSVIIPVYNGEKFLGECLDSMTRQDFCEGVHEVVVVDDGSTDSSAEIASEYCKKYPYFKFIQTKNQGVSAARNIGILQSSGEYITFMDADDMFADNSYLPLLKTMQEKGTDLLKFYYTQEKNELQKFENIITKYTFFENFCPANVWIAFFKREIIISRNVFFTENQAVFEDYIFNFKYCHNIKNGCGIVNLKPYYYRKNINSCTESAKDKKHPDIRKNSLRKTFDGSFIAMQEIKKFVEENGFEKDDFYNGAISACMQTYLLVSVYLKEKPSVTISRLKDIGFSLSDLKIKNIEGPTVKEKIKSEIMYLMRYRPFFVFVSFIYKIFGS